MSKIVTITYHQTVVQEMVSTLVVADDININDLNEFRDAIQEQKVNFTNHKVVKETVIEDLQDMVVLKAKDSELTYVVDSCFKYGEKLKAVGMEKVRLKSYAGNDIFGWQEVLENPTETDILKAVNRAIMKLGDFHHVFFEGLDEVVSTDSIPTFELCMGS